LALSSLTADFGQANSIADKLLVEAKVLADLKIEKAAVQGEHRKVEADLAGAVSGDAAWRQR